MRKKWVFMLALLSMVLFRAAPSDSYEEREGSGLEIRSEPPNAKVYINGIERGYTPLSLPDLIPGAYVVWLVKESYADRQIKVTIPEKGRVIISLDMEKATGTVTVNAKAAPGLPSSVPFKPEIYVDGEYQSGAFLTLNTGLRTIRVRAFGFEDESRTVTVGQGSSEVVDIALKPALYTLSGASLKRVRFNPANSGSLGMTECVFEVNAPAQGAVTVKNSAGAPVYSKDVGPFSTWSQSVSWDGRAADGTLVPDGVYTFIIETISLPWDGSSPITQTVSLELTIDSSLKIFPGTMASAQSGLLFAETPDILPRGSYQLDAIMLFGKAPASPEAWSNLPLAFSFRVSPASFLEAAVSLNVTPEFGERAIIGAGASVKWQIKKAGEIPLGIAAAFTYGWAQEGPMTPFTLGTGPEISVPLSWVFGEHAALILSPALLWAGPQGYPDTAVPIGIVSAGFSYRYTFFTSGISVRTEYIFESGLSLGPVSIGGEIKLFPKPSVIVFSLIAGASYEWDTWGGFGGIGIGFIQ